MITNFGGEYRFLSNFYPSPVYYAGYVFPAAEHAYQAMKCADHVNHKLFLVGSAANAKKLGRRVRIRGDWEEVKLNIMWEILLVKFSRGTDLAERLLATGEEELVEGNWWGDTFWGQCPLGVGENHLGKTLMKVRTELQKVQE